MISVSLVKSFSTKIAQMVLKRAGTTQNGHQVTLLYLFKERKTKGDSFESFRSNLKSTHTLATLDPYNLTSS